MISIVHKICIYASASRRVLLLRAYLCLQILVLFFISGDSLLSQKNPYIGKKISHVAFYGLRNVSVTDIKRNLKTKIKDSYDPIQLNRDIKALFATQYFENISLRVRTLDDGSLRLNFQVKERPQLKQLHFVGNSTIAVQDMITELQTSSGSFLSIDKIEEDINFIQGLLKEKGLLLGEVFYKLSEPNTKTNQVDLYFIFDEGERIPVSKINIIGAKYVDPDKIHSILSQKEGESTFNVDKFEEDKTRILYYYQSKGFLNTQLDPRGTHYKIKQKNPKKSEAGRVSIINYKIIEGKIQYFAGYSIKHVKKFINEELNPSELKSEKDREAIPVYTADVIKRFLKLSIYEVGQAFNNLFYQEDLRTIYELYGNQGYVFAQVSPRFIDFELSLDQLEAYDACLESKSKAAKARKCHEEASLLDLVALRRLLERYPGLAEQSFRHVHLSISENHIAFIEDIIIRGNDKTDKKIILREIVIKKGELFNSRLVSISRQNLINLQFFSEVSPEIRVGSTPEKMIIIFRVKEQGSGNINLGAQYSPEQGAGFALNAMVSERNFLGKGYSLSGSINFGPSMQSLSFAWREPWLYEACSRYLVPIWKSRLKGFDEALNEKALIALAQRLVEIEPDYAHRILFYIQGTLAKDPRFQNKVRRLDAAKAFIRTLIAPRAIQEERCFRSTPRPWSLSLGASISSQLMLDTSSQAYTSNSSDAEYTENRYSISLGTSHRLNNRWSHSHSYSPGFSSVSNPSGLVSDNIYTLADRGLVFISSLNNSLTYSSINDLLSPSSGSRWSLAANIIGGITGGSQHFNRYRLSKASYFTWTDFTFGGLIPRKNLRSWRITQEFTASFTLTDVTRPVSFYPEQDSESYSYLNQTNRLQLGAHVAHSRFGRLRATGQPGGLGPVFPVAWSAGAHHMLLFGTELRIPIVPRLVSFAAYLDAGSLFNSLDQFTRTERQGLEDSVASVVSSCQNTDASTRHFRSCEDWHSLGKTELGLKNIALDRFIYAIGYGIRLQIPQLPLRIYLARTYYYDGRRLKTVPGTSQEFIFTFDIFSF